MKPPKSLHLTSFYHAQSGGIGALYRALLAHANRCGREMCLVVPGEQSGCEAVGTAVVYTVRSPRSPWFDDRYRVLLPIGRPGKEIAQILRREQPDILEVADKYTLPYISGMLRKGIMAGVKRPTEIATSHERLDDNVAAHLGGGWLGTLFAKWYVRSIYFGQFDHHLANSEYTAAELVPASRRHTLRRGIWVCPMGVDTQTFTPGPARAHEGRQLLYAGRIAPEKNIGLLIQAMERLEPEYRLEVIGDGPLREWFQRECERRIAGRVRCHGHIADRAEHTARLRQADAFVHPNPREPFGIGPLEAMACGIPVLAPRSGGVLSYAREDNAWLYEPSARALADTVRSVFADPAERTAKTARALRTAEEHDWSVIAQRFFDILDELHHRGWRIDIPPLGAAMDAWLKAEPERHRVHAAAMLPALGGRGSLS